MSRVHAEASAVIPAPAATIYAILSDYREAHPQILPKEHFSNLEVEQGGQGAGTVFRVQGRALGVEQQFHMIVSEPEPGRVLSEMDSTSGLVTTFTVTPEQDEQHSRVRIATDWEAAPGLKGVFERFLTPPLMRRVYAKELRQLADYVQRRQA